MPVFDRSALNPGVAPREVFAWAMYDFANSGYTTVVLTAVFNAYFVGAVAGNASWATLAWTLALAASSLLVMLSAPAIGAWADAHGAKKRLLLVSTVGCVAGTVALSFAQPGTIALAVIAVIVSNYFFSLGEGLAAAFLPELSRQEALGKVSGWGWSFGYFGGMLTLGLCLAIVLSAKAAGEPATAFVPSTMLVTAAVFALAAAPTFLLLKERARGGEAARAHGSTALQRLAHTWGESARFRDFRRLLVCGCSYQAGIAVVIALAAVYAEQAMGFTQTQTMMLVFLVNIASAAGAFLFGYAQDRVGHKRALAWTLWGWVAMVAVASLGRSVDLFWLAATLAGLCMGSSQSCGRAMVGAMSPPERLAEFYGLWTFAVRLAAIVGPVTYGLVTWVTDGNHRLAIGITGLFFLAALAVLRGIDVERGIAAAR
ncbi:MAG TPA: MFS transporter [Quisquiliibacterium sp.]|nr:MFS transporter [Quisquiliibacterium sp.]